MNLARRLGLPTVILADTGHALVILNTQTGHITARLGTDRHRWTASSPRPAPIVVDPAPPGWGSTETPACLPAPIAPPARWVPAALTAIALTLAVRALGTRRPAFRRMLVLAHAATLPRRTAHRRDAQAALRAVRWVARGVPARIACLEESITALITLALSGRRAGWCHGIATDPIRMHAWIETDGEPVDEPASTSGYTPLIRIPPTPKPEAPW